MKVALIHPPGNKCLKVPPLGLAYLTAVLKNHEIETQIIDLNVENINLSRYLAREKPEIVGISSIVTNARHALEIAKQTKHVLPESFVVMGGPYASMIESSILTRHKEIDALLRGEAENTFLELVKQLQTQNNLNSVEGLTFRNSNKIKNNILSKPISPLDKIPHPAREELKMELYKENAGVIFTSRGCPHQCIFCSRPVFGRLWRGHSPEYVLEEIEQLLNEHGISILSVLDDNFTVDLKRAIKILEGIIAKNWNLDIYFWNGLRADHMTNELASKLKKAGCTAINFGVESVDPEVNLLINKGVTMQQIENAIKTAQKSGIQANAFLMIGNPGDNTKSADKLIDFVKKTNVDGVHLSMATPIFGTKFWDWVEQNGRWLNYDQEELLDWPVDDVSGAYPVFETSDFTASERITAYEKVRKFLEENELAI
ncbi:MAG: radical SAM protein [Candidatus Bathyarchaeota archaeon]|nr:radical SAM protein [Candidatus Bathyarchaeum tardum]WGM89853.1 MAG: radical SAM protein [Candidatus Bathyarchaeum tardum]